MPTQNKVTPKEYMQNLASYGGGGQSQFRQQQVNQRWNQAFGTLRNPPTDPAGQPLLNRQQQAKLFVNQLTDIAHGRGADPFKRNYPAGRSGLNQAVTGFNRLGFNAGNLSRAAERAYGDTPYWYTDINYGRPLPIGQRVQASGYEPLSEQYSRKYPYQTAGYRADEVTNRYLAYLDTGKMPPPGPIDYQKWREAHGGTRRYDPTFDPMNDPDWQPSYRSPSTTTYFHRG